jgi:GGDEF domain-containing protein
LRLVLQVRLLTVNITCTVCDGRVLCDACRSAARTLTASGCIVEHSTRYAALKAAASGTYGFDACVVPVADREHAVIDAAVTLLSGKRLLIVFDGAEDTLLGLSPSVTTMSRTRYAAGEFDTAWLAQPRETGDARLLDDTATIEIPASETLESQSDRAVATRRVAQVASIARETLARADLPQPPRLDMLAVLADEVVWAQASGAGFCVVLVHLPGLSSTKSSATVANAESKLRAALEVIAGAVRSTDIVSGRGDDFLAVLHEANDRGAELAAARIAAAVAAAPLRSASKTRRARGFAAWSVGRARYPADGASPEALLARATATLEPIDVRRL